MTEESKNCDYKKNSNKPCETYPRLITALYKCGLLQEAAKEVNNEEDHSSLTTPKDERQ